MPLQKPEISHITNCFWSGFHVSFGTCKWKS